MQLGNIARARGVRLLELGDIDSTNEEARRLIETGERGPLWILAARQTKGRGRLGREWISPAGNLHASFVHSGFPGARVAPQLGFVAGVAAILALRACAGDRDFSLKWPNDLLLGGDKLGGILLECVGAAEAPVAIIGVGVNVTQAPDDLPYPASSLSALGADAPTASQFFTRFSDSMMDVLDIWREGDGFARIRDEWINHAAGLGEQVRVALSGETLEGTFDGVDASGRFVLKNGGDRRVIEAGDVSLGPRRTEGARL